MSADLSDLQRDRIAEAVRLMNDVLADGIDITELSRVVLEDPAVAALLLDMMQRAWRDAMDCYATAVGSDPLDVRAMYRELLSFSTMRNLY